MPLISGPRAGRATDSEVPSVELRGPLQAYLSPFGWTLVECRPVHHHGFLETPIFQAFWKPIPGGVKTDTAENGIHLSILQATCFQFYIQLFSYQILKQNSRDFEISYVETTKRC